MQNRALWVVLSYLTLPFPAHVGKWIEVYFFIIMDISGIINKLYLVETHMSKRNASPSAFGWQFQCNAAIVLMLENIEKLESVRIEGETEDIEIYLEDNKCYYSQAKSVTNSEDYSNVNKNLINALETLNEASVKNNCEQIIYITNSPNPFNNKLTMYKFSSPTNLTYDELPEPCKNKIDKYIDENKYENIDKSKLQVVVFYFESDNLVERFKVVKTKIAEFLNTLHRSTFGMAQEVMDAWQRDLFNNCTLQDTSLHILKEDLIWPIIVLRLEYIEDRDISDDIEEDDEEEIKSKYKDFINNQVDKFEFATKVLTDYNKYDNGNIKDKANNFVSEKWTNYRDEFLGINIDVLVLENLIKIIIRKIIRNRRFISEVKKKVKL